MSEQKMASTADGTGTGTGKSRQSVQASQPVWMAHWMRPSSNAVGKRRGCGNEDLDSVYRGKNVINVSKDSRPIKESRVVETKKFESANSKEKDNGTTCWSLMKHGHIADNEQTPRGVFSHRDKATDCNGGTQFSFRIPVGNEASFGRWKSGGEGTSKIIPEWMKTHSPATDRSIPALKLVHGPIVEASSHIVPYYDIKNCEFDKAQKEFDKGKSPLIVKSVIIEKDQFPNSNMRTLQQEHCYKHDKGADLFLEPAMGVCFRDRNTSVLFDADSTSHHYLPALGPVWTSFEMFPGQGIISKKTESKKPCCNCYSRQKLPYCVHDTKTTRICATMDSVESTPVGFPRFSQTTHRVLITKGVDVSKENTVFQTTELGAETNNNTSTNIHSLSPFSGQAKRGLELHSLSSSSNSKGKRKIEDTMASKVRIKNESSAETDAMDMDVFKEENSDTGANHSPSIKSVNIGSTLLPSTSCGEPKNHWRKVDLELPALPASASSSPNACPTSSRTPSLDMNMDTLPLQSEHQNQRFNTDSSKADPTMRWFKRLKLRSSDSFAQGTHSSNLGNETREFFTRLLKSDVAVSEPTPKSHRVHEELISNYSKKGNESLLSQAWIKRWLRSRSEVTKKKSTEVICEPQNFKSVLDDYQKKQLPSIAAMALMAKAMNGLQSCELQKRESFTIWNTKAF